MLYFEVYRVEGWEALTGHNVHVRSFADQILQKLLVILQNLNDKILHGPMFIPENIIFFAPPRH